MGVFDFIKKKEENTPPDVGKEEPVNSSQNTDGSAPSDGSGAPYDPGELPPTAEDNAEGNNKTDKENKENKTESNPIDKKSDALSALKLERIDARVESINSMIKGLNERFSTISQQIGEVRGMSLSNEKAISKLSAESAKAIDIVNAVKPEQIRFDYQKAEGRIDELSGKIDSNKEYMNTLLEEMKDLRRKADSFIGTDGLLQLQTDVKKDLLNIQQTSAKARMHADKSEQLFIEMQKMSAQYSQLMETLSNFETNYSSLKKDFEKIKLDFTNIATKNELSDIKKRMESKMSLIDQGVNYVEKSKNDTARILRLVESTVALSKKNEQEIVELGMSLGNNSITKVSEYDDKLRSLLAVIDSLAGQMFEIRRKVGMNATRIKMPAKNQTKEGRLVLKNIEVNPQISAKILPSQENQIEKPVPKVESPTPNINNESIDNKNDIASSATPITENIPIENKSDISSPNSSIDNNIIKPEAGKVNSSKEITNPVQKEAVVPAENSSINMEKNEENIDTINDKINAPPAILTIAEPKNYEDTIDTNLNEEAIQSDDVDVVKTERHKRTHYRRQMHKHQFNKLISSNSKIGEFGDLDAIGDFEENNIAHGEQSLVLPLNATDEEITNILIQQIKDGFAMVDEANREELERRYLFMKQLYSSLSKKNEKFYRRILEFYERMNGKFYTSAFE